MTVMYKAIQLDSMVRKYSFLFIDATQASDQRKRL